MRVTTEVKGETAIWYGKRRISMVFFFLNEAMKDQRKRNLRCTEGLLLSRENAELCDICKKDGRQWHFGSCSGRRTAEQLGREVSSDRKE